MSSRPSATASANAGLVGTTAAAILLLLAVAGALLLAYHGPR